MLCRPWSHAPTVAGVTVKWQQSGTFPNVQTLSTSHSDCLLVEDPVLMHALAGKDDITFVGCMLHAACQLWLRVCMTGMHLFFDMSLCKS